MLLLKIFSKTNFSNINILLKINMGGTTKTIEF